MLGYGFDYPSEHFELVRCTQCDLTRIAPPLADDKLAAYYAADYYGQSTIKKFTLPIEYLVRFSNQLRARKLINLLPAALTDDPTNSAILDIGCGRGYFIQAMHQHGFNCFGTEIPAFPLPTSTPRMTFKHEPLQTLGLPQASCAAISIWHVLEHTSDPLLVIKQASELLKPGGILAIAVPNFGSYQRRLFGHHWFHLDLPRHLFHFNEKSLLTLLERNNLHVVSIQTNALDQNLFGFIQSALNSILPRQVNLLYTLLKRKNTEKNSISKVFYGLISVLLAACLLPISLLENVISSACRKGATLIIYARK